MNSRESVSIQQARKIALLSQGIHKPAEHGSGKNAVRRAIASLGYIQIDTISVVERAHHHTLWNRVNNYQHKHLEQLLADKEVFEYWSHAAAYLPMHDYRFSLPRKRQIASGEKHWYTKDRALKKLSSSVLKRVAVEGPLSARDFERDPSVKNGDGWWDWKPAKRALEQLFMEGELMISHRQGFQKVYDLPERVLPAGTNTSLPSDTELYSHLIFQYLHANGFGTAAQFCYLRKGIKPSVTKLCQQLVEDRKLIAIEVAGENYYAWPQVESLLSKPLSRTRIKILSPFDNLLIQRQRLKTLFDFDYQIECYVPAAKRKYGYFSLPILWGQKFAGRMDAKIHRKTGILNIVNLVIETYQLEEFVLALKLSLDEFLAFNQGQQLTIERIGYCDHNSDSRIKPMSSSTKQKLIKQLCV